MRQIAIALSIVLLLTSCAAQSIHPTTVHVDATKNELEHDQTITSEGTIDFYPSSASPHEIIFTGQNGSTSDAICMDSACSNLLVRVKNSAFPDGSLRLLQTDDPNIFMVKDAEGATILGYVAKDHGGTWKLLPDLEQAQTYEHHGDTARTVGKVLLGVLVVGVIVAVQGAAAAAGADRR
ncbi:MAG TPA: hypothetical protein VEU51_07905 [Candidatus Acidoferrales bacterium]|nr:hypothetical protein [Candidatus Acidoferrales bacterium]